MEGSGTKEYFAMLPADKRQREVLNAVTDERYFQDRKHGTIEDQPHTPGGWLLLIEDELDEAKKALIKGGCGRDEWRHEILQVAALCVAALEQHGVEPSFGEARNI